MRTFAIGDIHGCATALDTLLKTVPFSREDTLVTLGDYVDRGPDSRGVIERLIALRSEVNLVTLRGNHEVMMLLARQHRAMLLDWCECGGDATLASYMTAEGKSGEIPEAHWEFVDQTLPFHETEGQIFVHATVNPRLPMVEQTDHSLYWDRGWSRLSHVSGRVVVCGHTPQREGVPADIGHLICIDTHAFGGGWLTCLEPATRRYWQADEKGRTREGQLVKK